MKKDIAISLKNISKLYKLYDKPIDRLKESLHPFKKKYHKEFYALKDINLEVKKGEVLGIVGVNGAGKSTLLKIISGVLTPTTGRVNIHGRVNAILELGSALKPELTGRENIKLNLQINEINENTESLTQEIINFSDIGEHIDQPVKSYSSGMKTRLGFGIATSTDPDILIVDEVLAVGDVLFQKKCYTKIEKLFKDGKTVIFVSHSAQSVIQFCTRAILLYDRKIILDDTPKKVTDYYQKLIFSKDKQKTLNEASKENKADRNRAMLLSSKGELVVVKEAGSYLPDLKIKPQFINEECIQFASIIVENLNGSKVNLLDFNEEYIVRVNLVSKYSLVGIRFGLQFKDIKGVLISGVNTRDYGLREQYELKALGEYEFSVKFKCMLLPSEYILRVIAANESISCIVENAYIFKVKGTVFNQAGFVNLGQELSLKEVRRFDKS